MLVKLGRISADDVARCTDQFDLLDHHQRGYLARDDVGDVAVEPAEPEAPATRRKAAVSFDAAPEKERPIQKFRRASLAVKAASRIRRASLFQPKPLPDVEEHPL